MAWFTFTDASEETFVARIDDPDVIAHARELLAGTETADPLIGGIVVTQPAPYNIGWSYHLDPESIFFFEFSIEVGDATMRYIEEHVDEVGGAFLPGSRWTPWTSVLLEELQARSGGADRDLLVGTIKADLLFGKAGDDRLLGAAGNDHLVGGSGRDKAFGGQGDDKLGGGAGNDRLRVAQEETFWTAMATMTGSVARLATTPSSAVRARTHYTAAREPTGLPVIAVATSLSAAPGRIISITMPSPTRALSPSGTVSSTSRRARTASTCPASIPIVPSTTTRSSPSSAPMHFPPPARFGFPAWAASPRCL